MQIKIFALRREEGRKSTHINIQSTEVGPRRDPQDKAIMVLSYRTFLATEGDRCIKWYYS